MNTANNRGIVLCFLIYLALCATIVSIIEMPWVVVPAGSEMQFNVSESMMALIANDSHTSKVTDEQSGKLKSPSNITWEATIPGYCGLSGLCLPFEENSGIVSLISRSGTWGSRCDRIDPLQVFTNREEYKFDMVQHLPLYLSILGAVFLLFTWIVGICACCNHDCGYCTIYSLISVMLTFGTSVFLAGILTFFVFAPDPDSCIQQLCGDVDSAFAFGHCVPGWSLYVGAGGLLFSLILAIASCVLAAKTPLGSRSKQNQIIEVQPAANRGGGRMMGSKV